MSIKRHSTKAIKIKDLVIGGNADISVQTMTNLPLSKTSETIEQINRLAAEGASLVRLAVLTVNDADYLKDIIRNVSLPLCADIHFDYRIALKAIEYGIGKIRLNPGNIENPDKIKEVVAAAKQNSIPIRIGVNGGSINSKKYKEVTPEALVDSAMSHINILESLNFDDICVSIKTSDVYTTVEANRMFSEIRNYPMHLGLTEAGYGAACIVQSSMCIGSLLMDGIGDTIRVSMTGDPFDEVKIGYEILKNLGLLNYGVKIISCPTCGRTDTEINLLQIAENLDNLLNNKFCSDLKNKKKLLKIAVMGCEVNGPGEASHADVGIAGARSGNFLLFANGKILRKIHGSEVESAVCAEVQKIIGV